MVTVMDVGRLEATPTPDWLPHWVQAIGSACWVSDPEGRLVHVNAEARRVFDVGDEALGSCCHEVVRGLDEAGGEYCRSTCPIWCDVMLDRPLRPITLRTRGPSGRGPWSLVWIVPLTGPHGSHPWLVHCACSQERAHRIEAYLERIADSTPSSLGHELAVLTPRQREILALLASADDAKRIARDLHLSYATIRNHVRQILERLDAHSIQEAVARYLLVGAEEDPLRDGEVASGS
jgi:DNA-binding CsgD family transcriptional regulator